MITALTVVGLKMHQVVLELVTDLVTIASDDQRDVLLHAITKTGLDRAAGLDANKSGSTQAGRYDFGVMYNGITWWTKVEGNTITGYWGWAAPEEYFLEQDNGFGKVVGAHSILNSFSRTTELFAQRLADLAKS